MGKSRLAVTHSAVEDKHRKGIDNYRINENHGKMRQYIFVTAVQSRLGSLNTVIEGQNICGFLERPADKVERYPHARKPATYIRKQSAADSSHRLFAQKAAAKQTYSDIKKRYGQLVKTASGEVTVRGSPSVADARNVMHP